MDETISVIANMTNNLQSTSAGGRSIIEFDANIIGAGVSRFCRLCHFRHFGQKVRLFEEGGDV